MKSIIAIVVVCFVFVGSQAQPRAGQPPPPPSAAGPPSSMTKPAPPPMQGCSPGCGATDICVALADNYVRPGQRTSVCAKMSSIRFPTAALSSILKMPGTVPSATHGSSVSVSQPGPQYYPQQQQQSGSNMLWPALMMGGFDMGFGF